MKTFGALFHVKNKPPQQEGVCDVIDTDWRKEQKEIADAKHDELVKKYGDDI